jgi:hypothetical protein
MLDFLNKGCGSELDPDSVTLWIRIRIGNPDPGARKLRNFSGKKQGCGSGSGLAPDSATLWIRIRIGNTDPGARKLRNFSGKNALFSYIFYKSLPLKRYKITPTTFWKKNL